MKIPFSIKYKPQIESGKYKVETRDGKPARILCWDRAAKEDQPKDLKLCVLVQEYGGESVYYYYPDGTKWVACDDYSLFIVTPEEELTEFEIGIRSWIRAAIAVEVSYDNDSWYKNCAKQLLALARDQFIKDGYVIEKKAFHDAVEKVAPEVMNEVSDKVDMEEALHLEYERGKADALKDLPRWERITLREDASFLGCRNEDELFHKGRVIALSKLEKLPGFNE